LLAANKIRMLRIAPVPVREGRGTDRRGGGTVVCWAVIPIKAPSEVKTRLSPVLSLTDRLRLADRMLGTVVRAATQVRDIAHSVVVSPVPLSHGSAVETLRDAGTGLNDALALARDVAIGRGATQLVVLTADLPLATTAAIESFLRSARNVDVAVQRDRHRCGTNALFLRSPATATFRFGTDSARAHLEDARCTGRRAIAIDGGPLALDVDTPDDLDELMRIVPDHPLNVRTESAA
jgi:2-phospho-L-lactate guanylyltransferase